jgi:uncharacterized protein
MKIIIPGGSGQVGTVLARAFTRDGHEVVVLSRKPQIAPWRVVQWDGLTLGGWVDELNGADAIINLTGRSVNCRYNPNNRREIVDSRIHSIRVLAKACAEVQQPPRVWLQASTATIYAHRYDAANDETSGIIGGQEPNAPDTWRFSIDVAKEWERTFDETVLPRTRKIKLRSAMTMSPDQGGIFDTLLSIVRHGLGGYSGDGRQYVSWIHYEDFIRIIYWLLDHDKIDGVINVAAPNPLPNLEFMRALRKAWGISFGLPASKWMLEIGAMVLRTETELILKSRRVIPGRLLNEGFTFHFPNWSEAACDLCSKFRVEELQRTTFQSNVSEPTLRLSNE